MALAVADFPRNQYGGAYFELFEDIYERRSEAARVARESATTAESMKAAAEAMALLESLKPGDVMARVYAPSGVVELIGSKGDAEAFVKLEMTKLKVGG